MDRIQISLEQDDRQMLEKLARDTGKSKSAYVRDLIRRAALRAAADRMVDDYRQDPALTAFSSLDGENFLAHPKPR